MDLATWIAGNGQSAGDGVGGAGGPAAPGLLGLWSATPTVAGEVEVRDGVAFGLSEQSLDFGEATALLAFYVINVGTEELRYKVSSNVAWATVNPTAGTNNGGEDRIEVRVQRAGLPKGRYTGRITVTAEGGGAENLAIAMTVGPAIVELSATALDFGATAWTRGFTLRNAGGGTPRFTVVSDVPWLVVRPSEGELVAEPSLIEVHVRRDPMLTGTHVGGLQVLVDGRPQVAVRVSAQKSLTAPRLMPWVEVYSNSYGVIPPGTLERAVEGLLIWQRVTDTAVVTTTPGNARLYAILNARVPGMRIVPGLISQPYLGKQGFDQLDLWRDLAAEVADIAAVSGDGCFLFDHEHALESYLEGACEINFARLRDCLATLPPNVEYIWYPSLAYDGAQRRARSLAICQVVEAELHPRFVNLGFDHPRWREFDPWWYVTLDKLAAKPTVPLIYFGCWQDCFWDYSQISQVLKDIRTYPENYADAIVYPSLSRWVEAAAAITAELSQDPPLP